MDPILPGDRQVPRRGAVGPVSETAQDDERWFVVKGRRWRRQDPELPDDVAARLRSYLGRARNAVKAGKQAGDESAVRAARDRVGLAKHGLGERGTPWWEQTSAERRDRWRAALDALENP